MKTLSMKVLVVLLIFGSSSLVLYSCILDGDSDFKTLTDSDSSSKIFTPKANSTNLPAEEKFALYHPKDIGRQEKQNAFYDTI